MFGSIIGAANKILKKRIKRRKKRKEKRRGGLLGGRPSKLKRKKRRRGFLGKKLNKKGKPKKPKKKIAFNGTNDIVRRPPGDRRRVLNKKRSLISTGKGPKPKKKIKPGLLQNKRHLDRKK